MASKITFACPDCGATLSVSDRSKLGKKIKCPKCQEIFIPEVPEEEDDDLDQVQMIEDTMMKRWMTNPLRVAGQQMGNQRKVPLQVEARKVCSSVVASSRY